MSTRFGVTMNPDFGTRLAKLRKEWKFTQAELARRAGISQSWVNHIEKGRRLPSHRVMTALAGAFDHGCDELRELLK